MTEHGGVCLLGVDGEVLYCDDAFERGLGVEVLRGARLAALTSWLSGLRPDVRGTFMDRRVSLTVLPTGLPHAAAVVRSQLRMVTPAFGLARDLDVTRRTLSSILDSAPISILTMDLQKKVTMWNAAATSMFGWTPSEVLGRDYPLVAAEDADEFDALFRRVVSGQGFTGLEVRRHRKDGTSIDLRIHTAPMRDGTGRVTGAMAILEDLTEQRRLESRILHSQKMEAVGRLAGGIAHDFNNLLTVILGTAEVLSLGQSLSPRTEKGLKWIQECGERASQLTAQLLAFSRRQVLHPEVVDMSEQVRATAGLLSRLIGEQIEMKLELAEAPLLVKVDAGQFDQVLINLAVNARDAMQEGGVLVLRTCFELVAAGASGLPPGAYARLEVCDTGRGIPEDVLPHIFDPFYTTKDLGQGTGLGLATVHGVMEQSGGSVVVRSEAGRGATFVVRLPIAEGDLAPPPTKVSAAGPAIGAGLVLLVEDDAQVRRVAARMVRTLGYRVTTAEDGVDALAQLDGGLEVDVLLTDLAMPRMGGRALAEAARAKRADLPIIYASANLDDPALREQVDAGEVQFIQKPFALSVLAEELVEALRR